MADPAIEEWRQAINDATATVNAALDLLGPPPATSGEAASARLRQTQQALAASQADLTRVEAELARLKAEPCAYHGLAVKVMRENTELRAQLDAVRSWRAAEQDVGPCARCGLPIVRSQAVEPMPGTTKGSYAHVTCPTPKENHRDPSRP